MTTTKHRRLNQGLLGLLVCSLVVVMIYVSANVSTTTFYTRQHSATPESDGYYNEQGQQKSPEGSDSFHDRSFYNDKAFVTTLFDSTSIDAAIISIYSLQAVSTRANIVVVLAANETSKMHLFDRLNDMNIHLLHAFDDTNPITQALGYYQKIVYFSSEILFKKNVDHYFGYPVNTHLEKNGQVGLRIYERSKESPPLLVSVNFPLSNQEALWFNGPMKPWNFHQYHDTDWRKFYDPVSFYQWRSLYDRVITPSDSNWVNQQRRKTICATQSPRHPENLVQDRFSVLLSTYRPERIQHLTLLIRHLLQSSMVHKVFITWHNPNLAAPVFPAEWDRVEVLRQSFDSLNNRFNPVDAIETEAVYILDDDVFIDVDDLEFTFQVWQSGHKDSIVGHFPRIHQYNPDTHEGVYKVSNKDTYSMVLTKSMFVHVDYLYAYTCLMETELHRVIDGWTNCEDIAFNMMVTGLSGAPAVAVRPEKPLIDFGLDHGISTNMKHMGGRSECVGHFITNYWNTKDPLHISPASVVPYGRPQINRGKWENIEATLQRNHFNIVDVSISS